MRILMAEGAQKGGQEPDDPDRESQTIPTGRVKAVAPLMKKVVILMVVKAIAGAAP